MKQNDITQIFCWDPVYVKLNCKNYNQLNGFLNVIKGCEEIVWMLNNIILNI